MLIAFATVPRGADADADEMLELEVKVNGYPTNKIGEFVLRDSALLSRRQELNDLGFRVPQSSRSSAPDSLVPLSDVPGLTWQIDNKTQTLQVRAPDNALLTRLLKPETGPDRTTPSESGFGALLNYDLTGTRAGGSFVSSSLSDFRVFSPLGVASTGFLAFAGGGPRGPGSTSVIRLDSNITVAAPDASQQYIAGDFITAGLASSRPVRMGGVQISADFSMRPDLITYPLPSVSGSVGVPSTIDVLVNGNRLLSRAVEPGPFQVAQLPIVSGAGTVALTVTDPLGRQVLVQSPFYASPQLLASGLQTYSLQAGAVRRNWGLLSDDYGGVAASGSYRRGLFNALTLEASTEVTVDSVMVNVGVLVNVFELAVANVSAAASLAHVHDNAPYPKSRPQGSQLSIGLQRLSRVLSASVSATAASSGYRDIAAANGDPAPLLQINGSAGLSLGAFGSVGLSYTHLDRVAAISKSRTYLPPGSTLANGTYLIAGGVVDYTPVQRARILSASYSIDVRGASVYVTGFRDFARHNSSGVLFGVSIPLGARSSIGASLGDGSGGRSGQIQAQQSATSIGDWGYQASASSGSSDHEFAQLQYLSPWNLLTAGVDRSGSHTGFRTEAEGAVVAMGGDMFFANAIHDSFAVVDTGGLPGVRVLQENREVGRTNKAGQLLIPGLRSFDVNHVAIDPTDVPQDASVEAIEHQVRPKYRSGVLVTFPIQVSNGALLQLVDPSGVPLPLGSAVTLSGSERSVPVGFDGAAYVEHLQPRNTLRVVRTDGGHCTAAFDYHPIKGEIPKIGPLPCRDQPRPNGQ